MYTRRFFRSGGLKLSYVDFGGQTEHVIVALHGHFGTGNQFLFLAEKLDGWRLVALDQRGHGWSPHAPDLDYSRDSYIQDIDNLIRHQLNVASVVILGHSLGGANAYQYAGKHPGVVRALIIEDIGPENKDDLTYVRKFPYRTSTFQEMKTALDDYLGLGAFPYFAQSIVEHEEGWGFRFDTEGLIHSQELLNGSWWQQWNSVECPTLVLHGGKSVILSQELANEMIRQRPNTRLVEFPECGHTIHARDMEGYCRSVADFLREIGSMGR